MTQQGWDEVLLRRWFPTDNTGVEEPLAEEDVRGIADVLHRSSHERWSVIPRVYSVLRKIDRLDTIDAFLASDVTDMSFPFDKTTLPEALRDHSARLKFLELQHLVYNTEALNLERGIHHGHFGDSSDVPLKKIGELGKGGFGYVDRVVSTFSNREYARKLIPRGRTFRRDKVVLEAFVKELTSLKRLSHRHLVTLVASYTDKRFVALIMSPVADCDMETLLQQSSSNHSARPFLRSFFGCLAAALGYLHDNRIRHKDIKPSNILIKHDQVYLTDFGTVLDWSELGNSSTATAPPTTPRYCAPEVMMHLERNSSSDIWSLGCVFLEMWTVVREEEVDTLRAHMMSTGTHTKEYHANPAGYLSWIEKLRHVPGTSVDSDPSTWICNMLLPTASSRWSIHILENHIKETSIRPTSTYNYVGLCCIELDCTSLETCSSRDHEEEREMVKSRSQHPPVDSACHHRAVPRVARNVQPKVEGSRTSKPRGSSTEAVAAMDDETISLTRITVTSSAAGSVTMSDCYRSQFESAPDWDWDDERIGDWVEETWSLITTEVHRLIKSPVIETDLQSPLLRKMMAWIHGPEGMLPNFGHIVLLRTMLDLDETRDKSERRKRSSAFLNGDSSSGDVPSQRLVACFYCRKPYPDLTKEYTLCSECENLWEEHKQELKEVVLNKLKPAAQRTKPKPRAEAEVGRVISWADTSSHIYDHHSARSSVESNINDSHEISHARLRRQNNPRINMIERYSKPILLSTSASEHLSKHVDYHALSKSTRESKLSSDPAREGLPGGRSKVHSVLDEQTSSKSTEKLGRRPVRNRQTYTVGTSLQSSSCSNSSTDSTLVEESPQIRFATESKIRPTRGNGHWHRLFRQAGSFGFG